MSMSILVPFSAQDGGLRLLASSLPFRTRGRARQKIACTPWDETRPSGLPALSQLAGKPRGRCLPKYARTRTHAYTAHVHGWGGCGRAARQLACSRGFEQGGQPSGDRDVRPGCRVVPLGRPCLCILNSKSNSILDL